MEKNSITQALIYLLTCAVQCKPPKEMPEMDYDALYKLSRFHSVTAMVAMALESGGLLSEPHMSVELSKKWNDAKINAIRKNILLDTEREQILQFFEEQGIWYMPLKGSILKDLYPRQGMRQMADNDILFDKSFQLQVKDYMVDRGYSVEHFGKSNHDVYEKAPVYNYEFHTALFGATGDAAWLSYYDDVKNRLQKDADNGFGYHFSDEDFYVYITTHAYKHFRNAGSGIRTLADVYVYVSQKGKQMDWDYIRGELKVLGIEEYEEKSRALAMKLFAAGDVQALTREEQEMLDVFLGAGTYGTISNRAKNKLAALQADDKPITLKTKIIFCFQRLFPGLDFMKAYAPFCYRHRWAIPFYWVFRWVRAALFRRKKVSAEMTAVKKAE